MLVKVFGKLQLLLMPFLRQNVGRPAARPRPRIFSRGSSFRYSGRTQKQIIGGCQASFRPQPAFERSQIMKTPTRNQSFGNSAQPSTRSFNVYSNAETNRLMENAPPRPLLPFQEVTETEFPSLNGPTVTTKTTEQEKKQPNESSQEDTLAFVPESRGIIPLQDLDDEPDMMMEESDSPSEVASEPGLQSPEKTEAVVEKTEEVAESSQETPAEDGGGEEAHEEVDEGFEHGTPLNYFGANEVEGKLLVPEGCVRIEYQPQPKPPSPVEVSDVDTMSPPPPSHPPPLPQDEVGGEMRDEGVGQEFPSPPPEILPSPPPELTDEFEKQPRFSSQRRQRKNFRFN